MSKITQKLLCIILLMFTLAITACSRNENPFSGGGSYGYSGGNAVQNVPESVSKEYSKEEIYNAFTEAYDFYYSWIYGQYYIDSSKMTESNGVYYAPVAHDKIKTVNDLTQKIRSSFSETKANEFIAQLNPREINGVLYINCRLGVGDNGIGFDTYTMEKINTNTYIITLFLKDMFTESNIKSQIICYTANNQILFDDYISSPLADDSDFVLMFE